MCADGHACGHQNGAGAQSISRAVPIPEMSASQRPTTQKKLTVLFLL
jgi:hypothetical protein